MIPMATRAAPDSARILRWISRTQAVILYNLYCGDERGGL